MPEVNEQAKAEPKKEMCTDVCGETKEMKGTKEKRKERSHQGQTERACTEQQVWLILNDSVDTETERHTKKQTQR